MGLLASHGLTHHLLRVARARWRRRLSSSSSCSIITMAATPIKMLKWASCCSNSRLPSIVTTAEMTGGSKVTDFYTCAHIWGGGWRSLRDHLPVAGRSPNGDPPAIKRIVDIGQRSAGAPAVIGRSPGGGSRTEPGKNGHLWLTLAGHRVVACRWSAGDRWPSYHSGSRWWKSAGDLPMCKSGDPAKIRQSPLDLRCIETSALTDVISVKKAHNLKTWH